MPDSVVDFYLKVVTETCPTLSPEGERELLERVCSGDVSFEEVEQELVESNLHVVVSMARVRTSDDGTCLDLIQRGNEVLISAVRSFDPCSGEGFSTYARRCLDQEFGTVAA